MKPLLTLIFAVIPFLTYSQNQINILDTKGYNFNDILGQMVDCNISVKYDQKNKETYIYIANVITTTGYTLSAENVDSMNVMFDKYFKWEEKAIKMSVKLEKTIKDLSLKGWFKYGNGDWSNSCVNNCLFRGLFFSQSESNHQLVFQFGKITHCGNEYLNHKPEGVYLSKEMVSELRKAFSSDFINNTLEKEKSKKSIEDEFK
tara:strand:+ start:624 stop:1232 length:609 start_codon:yes stop_codon:yes gene_type:complete